MLVVGVRTPQSAEDVHVLLSRAQGGVHCLLFARMRVSVRKWKGRKGGRSISASHVTSSPLYHNFL